MDDESPEVGGERPPWPPLSEAFSDENADEGDERQSSISDALWIAAFVLGTTALGLLVTLT
jgi:hypothetical protein